MKKTLLAATLILTASGVMAESQFQVGLGYSVNNLSGNDGGSIEFSTKAPEIIARYSFSNNFALESDYRVKKTSEFTYDGESVDSPPKYKGLDLNLLVGNHLIDKNQVYYYTGLGYFRDTYFDSTYSDFQVPLGVGYHFDKLSLEAQYLYKKASVFDDEFTNYDHAYVYALKLMYAL